MNGSSNDYVTPKPQCSCSKLAVFQALLTLPDACEQEYESDSQYCSYYDTDNDHAKFRQQSVQTNEYSPSAFTKSFFLSLVKENKQEPQQRSLLTRDYSHEFSTNISGKDRAPNFAALRALTSAAHYNSCWAFSSMPEISVMQSDDEFLVDAGIRIPPQFSVSQSTSKIPHLQDFIARRQLNTTVRSRRSSMNFDKGKFKRHSSVEYEDCMKRRISESDSSRSTSISIDYEEGLRQRNIVKENLSDQHLSKTDARTKRYSAPHGRTRFGWDAGQERSLDEKLKRNSLTLDKEKLKFTNSKCTLDRTKRHSTNFSLKLSDTKETKQLVKRHSLEDHTTVRRAIKGYFSTLDVNHNQGLSKIPLRNVESRSRTAPATRASSPVHVESRLSFDIENCDDSRSSANDRRLNRFSSSDEEVDKLCRMLSTFSIHSQVAQSSTGIISRSRERYPVHLLMKKL